MIPNMTTISLRPRKTPTRKPQLTTTYRKQEMSEWCWAACLEMVWRIIFTSWRNQCSFADQAFDRRDCCKSNDACNKGFEDLKKLFAETPIYKKCNYVNKPFTFDEIELEIRRVHPIIYVLDFLGHQTSHTGIILGFETDEEGQWVYIMDPDEEFFRRSGKSPEGWIKYEHLCKAYGLPNSKWEGTWYGLGAAD